MSSLKTDAQEHATRSEPEHDCLSRRSFLIGTGAAATGTVMLTGIPGLEGKAWAAHVARYPRLLIAKLGALQVERPQRFKYPDDGKNTNSMLVKLGQEAGGGIGSDRDVVAFNTLCTHMGADLGRYYKASDTALGPCPFHQSVFDLTRHGIIISGHATESLPQVLLELEGDEIWAVGMVGLIYGRYDNLAA